MGSRVRRGGRRRRPRGGLGTGRRGGEAVSVSPQHAPPSRQPLPRGHRASLCGQWGMCTTVRGGDASPFTRPPPLPTGRAPRRPRGPSANRQPKAPTSTREGCHAQGSGGGGHPQTEWVGCVPPRARVRAHAAAPKRDAEGERGKVHARRGWGGEGGGGGGGSLPRAGVWGCHAVTHALRRRRDKVEGGGGSVGRSPPSTPCAAAPPAPRHPPPPPPSVGGCVGVVPQAWSTRCARSTLPSHPPPMQGGFEGGGRCH